MLTYAGDPILYEYNSPSGSGELPAETVKIINTSPYQRLVMLLRILLGERDAGKINGRTDGDEDSGERAAEGAGLQLSTPRLHVGRQSPIWGALVWSPYVGTSVPTPSSGFQHPVSRKCLPGSPLP